MDRSSGPRHGLETLGQLPALALCAATILAVGLVTARRLARPG
jgi:hypothetical protein